MRQIPVRIPVLLAVVLLIGGTLVTDAAERRSEMRGESSSESSKALDLAESFIYQSGWGGEIEVDLEGAASVDIGRGGRAPGPGGMFGFEREVLVEGIAHYTADVRVGDGPHDVIRVHRVVKERSPYHPIKTHKNVFLLHGDAVGFVKFIFGVAAPSAPVERSVAIYLAQAGIDVWGMDQDWILVPPETTDFDFMADWGLQHQVDNLDLAVGLARQVRRQTGNGYARMNVLGYSSGAVTAYAYANQETQLPPGHRKMSGLIPVDFLNELDPADAGAIAWACGNAVAVLEALEAGVYVDTSGQLFLTLSYLANSAPGDPSPVFPGMTNLQAFLFPNTSTYVLFPINSWWHYMAGVFDENGLPYDLTFTTVDEGIDFMATASPYEPMAFPFDYSALLCDDFDLPFDDHIDEIEVPLLYIGPAGGVGATGVYATTQVGSDDVTLLMPQFYSDEERYLDFGHVDIWTAEVAEEIIWLPLRDWIVEHSRGGDNH